MRTKTYLLSNGGNDVISVTVRRAGSDDVDSVYELSLPFMNNGALIERDRGFYAAHIDEFFVIAAEGRIAACVGVRRLAEIAEILNVAVGKEWQGRGLGQLIIVHVLAELAAEQSDDVLLFSKTTVGWFERLGFERIDQGTLPPSRLALLDADRGSVPMRRRSARPVALTVRFARSGTERVWSDESGSLLAFAEDVGVAVDSLCWAGICGTCASPLRRGTVGYHAEPEGDPQQGEVLLCIAEPITDLLIDR